MSIRAARLAAIVLTLPSLALADTPPAPPANSPSPPPAASPAPTQQPEGYMVFPFENQTPIKALDWMATALPVTLAEKLESHPRLRPVYGASILDKLSATWDETKAALKASDVGARYVVAGSFSRPNWKAEVTVRVYEVVVGSDVGAAPQLKLLGETSARGERNRLFETLDEAALGALSKAGLGILGDQFALAGFQRRPTKDLYAFTLFGRGLNLFYGIAGNMDEPGAIKQLQKVVVIDPKFAEAHRMLGVAYLARGDTAHAAGQYAHALDLKPGYYAAVVGLAQLYRAEDKRQQAEEMAQKALELRAWDEETRFMLGQLQWEGGELDKSLDNLLKVVSEHPHHVGAHRSLVQVYASKGDIAAMATELEQVALLQPDDIDVRLDLGAALMRLGKLDRAAATFEEVLKRKPRHTQALKLVGDLYRKMGSPDRAAAAYERMRRLVPDDPRPYFLLAAAYMESGRDDKAESIIDEATQFHHYAGEIWTDMGVIAYRRGELKRAIILLQRAVARVPNRPKAHFNLALALDATNQRDQALVELKSAAELDPADADIPYLAGVIYLRLGKLDEAKGAFQAAIKLNPAHGDAQHNLALLEDLEKRYGTERSGVGAQ